MKLNPECIAKIILDVEALPSINNRLLVDSNYAASTGFSWEEIEYHVIYLHNEGAFAGEYRAYNDGTYSIQYLSSEGHKLAYAISKPRAKKSWLMKCVDALPTTLADYLSLALEILKTLR